MAELYGLHPWHLDELLPRELASTFRAVREHAAAQQRPHLMSTELATAKGPA